VTKTEFQQITDKPIEVITNGYDNEKVETLALDSKFSISHIGSLLSKRNPEVLWKVLAELIQENNEFAEDFQLNFIGSVSRDVLELIKEHGLNSYVNNIGYVSHKESIQYQKKSQVLLLIEIDSKDTTCIIPGKLFEYIVSNRPIIALGPKNSDVENIIKETNTGNYFSYNDYESLKFIILKYYKFFKYSELQSNAVGLKKYHRKALTESLSKLI